MCPDLSLTKDVKRLRAYSRCGDRLRLRPVALCCCSSNRFTAARLAPGTKWPLW